MTDAMPVRETTSRNGGKKFSRSSRAGIGAGAHVLARLGLAVAGHVLQRGEDLACGERAALALQAEHRSHAHLAAQVRILAECLFDAAPAWIARDVHDGREHEVRAVDANLAGDHGCSRHARDPGRRSPTCRSPSETSSCRRPCSHAGTLRGRAPECPGASGSPPSAGSSFTKRTVSSAVRQRVPGAWMPPLRSEGRVTWPNPSG